MNFQLVRIFFFCSFFFVFPEHMDEYLSIGFLELNIVGERAYETHIKHIRSWALQLKCNNLTKCPEINSNTLQFRTLQM